MLGISPIMMLSHNRTSVLELMRNVFVAKMIFTRVVMFRYILCWVWLMPLEMKSEENLHEISPNVLPRPMDTVGPTLVRTGMPVKEPMWIFMSSSKRSRRFSWMVRVISLARALMRMELA